MSIPPPDRIQCKGDTFKPFITEDQIEDRLVELGTEIDKEFEKKNPIFIGVLNGAFVFLADLIRHIHIPCEVDFIKLSSYGDEKVSSGNVKELKHVDAHLEGRHVILVEDIIDTGLSMSYLVKRIKDYNPASVKVITLLHKYEATKYDVQIDYFGFKIPNLFVLGYGLDYSQEGRNLPLIYVIDQP